MKRTGLILAALASCIFIQAAAQESMKSGYFVEGYTFRHQLNPAFASSRSYFSIPVAGNANIGVNSNMGIGTFLYPRDGQLTTFMNSSVSANEFLGQLKDNNKLNASVFVPFTSVGFWGIKGGFTTVEMGLKTNAMTSLPYGLFDFMKNLGAKEDYSINNIGIKASSYMEIALGHSRKVTDRLSIGAKVKFLVGVMRADAKVNDMQVHMAADKWSVNANGSLNMSAPMLSVPVKNGDEIDWDNIGMAEMNSFSDVMSSLFSGLGYGAALDLGAAYKFDDGLLDGLTLSAAVLDLGFISWGTSVNAVTASEPWEFDGFEDISLESGNENSLKEQMNSLADSFSGLLKFRKLADTKGNTDMLACTVNVGAEYEMPFYRRLSVGVLSSTRISGPYTFSEGRLSANVEPVDWFGLSTSYGISSFGSSWGAMVSFNFPGIGLFLGTDNIPTSVTKPIGKSGIGLPYRKTNFNLHFGLVFNVGKINHIYD